jgi:NAD(P)-dependent dehydrogenase (short-subunit alcohol dehydrogenase family)
VALVTGAGRGIGRDVALALAGDGASVALLGRSPAAVHAVLAEIVEAGGQGLAVPADVTRTGEVRAAVDNVTRHLGPVDLLVSNAGLRETAEAVPWEADPLDWWRVVETNLRGPFLLAHAVLPAMVARGAGRVLHVGSGMAHWPNPGWSAYATSKAAVSRLTDSLARALDGSGVTVLEASPGLVRTGMTETMWGPPEEQPWNPVDRMVQLVLRFARGDLDALDGRAATVASADARTLRLRRYGDDDPLG